MNRPFPSGLAAKCHRAIRRTNNNIKEERIGGMMIFNQQSARRPNKSRGGPKERASLLRDPV